MNWHQITASATTKQLRQFGLLVGIVLIVIGGWQFYRQIHPITRIILWAIGGGLFLIGLLAPKVLNPLYTLWMGLALILGWINTRILLGLIFYLVFTPIGLAMKVFKRDTLQRQIDKDANSYWVDREKPQNLKEHFNRQF